MSAADPNAWLRKANNDRRAIEVLSALPDAPWEIVCFHAQQEGEKLWKAVLVKHGVRPPRTHDAVRVLHLTAAHGLDQNALLDAATVLTTLVGKVRYPDDGAVEPTEVDAKEATVAAGRIRAAVLAHFASLPL